VNNLLDLGLRTAPRSAVATPPAVIYTDARVVTMERSKPSATAVAVAGKRIVAVGSLDAVKQALGQRAYTVDETFKGKVVLPGFIDQHLHPSLGALTLVVEVIAPEDWNLPGRSIQAASGAATLTATRANGSCRRNCWTVLPGCSGTPATRCTRT
jgi:hypothetical protein